jgi:hypothetical protein
MSVLTLGSMTDIGRQYAFTDLVGKLPLTTPMSATWNVHETGALGHEATLASAIGRMLSGDFGSDIGHSRLVRIAGRMGASIMSFLWLLVTDSFTGEQVNR